MILYVKQQYRKVKKKKFQKPEHGKKYVFLAKCIKNAVLRENTVKKSEENEPKKLNELLITDYTKVKNKEQIKTVAATRKP